MKKASLHNPPVRPKDNVERRLPAAGQARPLPSLQQILSALFRRKRPVFTVFLAIAAAVTALAILQPARYKSSMKILVKNERADLVVSPEATTDANRMAVREETINSEIELLRSKDLLQQVVVKSQLDRLEGRSDGSDEGKQAAIERAVENLSNDLEVAPIKKSNIIEVVYSSKDPALPAAVLQRLSEDYLEKHLRSRHSSGAYEFFKAQSDGYERRMSELKTQLATLREGMNLVDLDEQKRLNLNKLAELEAAQLKAEVEFQGNLSRAAETRRTLRSTAPRIQTEVKVLGNQYSIERLNTMLVELRNKRTQLLTKFQEGDRLVKEVEQQIRDTQVALDQALKDKGIEEFTDVNPVRPPLEGELARLEAGVAGSRAQKGKLAEQLGGYRTRLAALEAVTNRHKELENQIREAEDNYRLYSKKAEESRIADALDREKFANVTVAETPIRPLEPYRPNRMLTLTLGLLLAVFAGLGSAFAADYLSGTVHSPEELESFTGLPVFTTIPLLTARGNGQRIGTIEQHTIDTAPRA